MLVTTIYLLVSLVLWLSVSFGTVAVKGLSMYPTLNDKDILIASRLDIIKDVNKGDIVICHYPERGNKRFVKRVVAKEGDKIEIKEGLIFINGKDRTASYFDEQTKFDNDYPETTVPEGTYFVIGDNVNDSEDSRMVGFIDENDIIGVVILRIFPTVTKV